METAAGEKNVDIGADVVGAGGKKLGKVAYVVVKPPEMHLTGIVVDTGLILGGEVVVPARRIRGMEGGKVQLHPRHPDSGKGRARDSRWESHSTTQQGSDRAGRA